MEPAPPPFTRTRIVLGRCVLRRSPTLDESRRLGALLGGMDPWRRLGFPADGLAAYLRREDPSLHRFLIGIDGNPAGIIAIRHPWLRGPYIEMLGLDPARQGQGVGGELLRWAEDEARAVAGNLWVAVSECNGRARAFYERAGFEAVASLEGLVLEGHAELLLRKRLGQADTRPLPPSGRRPP